MAWDLHGPHPLWKQEPNAPQILECASRIELDHQDEQASSASLRLTSRTVTENLDRSRCDGYGSILLLSYSYYWLLRSCTPTHGTEAGPNDAS